MANPATTTTEEIIQVPLLGKVPMDYKSTSPNPYKEGNEKIRVFERGGWEAWTDEKTGKTCQYGPSVYGSRQPRTFKDAERLPIPELRATAIKTITEMIPDFGKRRAALHPLEDHKNREIYFFRWDDFSQPAKDSEMPPFVQVALYADGKLASFTDTLTR